MPHPQEAQPQLPRPQGASSVLGVQVRPISVSIMGSLRVEIDRRANPVSNDVEIARAGRTRLERSGRLLRARCGAISDPCRFSARVVYWLAPWQTRPSDVAPTRRIGATSHVSGPAPRTAVASLGPSGRRLTTYRPPMFARMLRRRVSRGSFNDKTNSHSPHEPKSS